MLALCSVGALALLSHTQESSSRRIDVMVVPDGLNVQAIAVDGRHSSAENAEIKMAIDFFHHLQ
jgi:hypothetical protein